MKKLKFVLAAATVAILAGCVKSTAVSGDEPRTVCPAVKLVPYHQVTLKSSTALPLKIAVMLEGARKYDECSTGPDLPPPPIVQFQRGQNNKAVLTVLHINAYPTLPSDVSFQIIDMENCQGTESTFYSATRVPLEFKKEFPHGSTCGSNTAAKVDVSI